MVHYHAAGSVRGRLLGSFYYIRIWHGLQYGHAFGIEQYTSIHSRQSVFVDYYHSRKQVLYAVIEIYCITNSYIKLYKRVKYPLLYPKNPAATCVPVQFLAAHLVPRPRYVASFATDDASFFANPRIFDFNLALTQHRLNRYGSALHHL